MDKGILIFMSFWAIFSLILIAYKYDHIGKYWNLVWDKQNTLLRKCFLWYIYFVITFSLIYYQIHLSDRNNKHFIYDNKITTAQKTVNIQDLKKDSAIHQFEIQKMDTIESLLNGLRSSLANNEIQVNVFDKKHKSFTEHSAYSIFRLYKDSIEYSIIIYNEFMRGAGGRGGRGSELNQLRGKDVDLYVKINSNDIINEKWRSQGYYLENQGLFSGNTGSDPKKIVNFLNTSEIGQHLLDTSLASIALRLETESKREDEILQDILGRLKNSYENANYAEWGFGDFLYFSIISLSFNSYGDILPNSKTIRMLISAHTLINWIILILLINAKLTVKDEDER